MTVVQILALVFVSLLVLIYGLMSAASNADDADDELLRHCQVRIQPTAIL